MQESENPTIKSLPAQAWTDGLDVNVGIKRLLSTLGAYRLLACNIEQDVSSENIFVQSKHAVSPKSGHEPQ